LRCAEQIDVAVRQPPLAEQRQAKNFRQNGASDHPDADCCGYPHRNFS
jgi:hypothetical protein